MQLDPAQRAAALRWRATTDEILSEHLGTEDGQYVLTGVGRDGERRYLIGERIDAALLDPDRGVAVGPMIACLR